MGGFPETYPKNPFNADLILASDIIAV